MRPVLLALVLLLAAHCTPPPPESYVGAPRADAGLDLGTDAAGEPCRQQADRTASAAIYCTDSDQPAGNVRTGGAAGPAELPALATASDWRLAFDRRFACEPPAPLALANAQAALLLRCTRRVGGWPQVAAIAIVDGKVYFADGISPLLPVLERAIGVLSGHLSPAAAPASPPSVAISLLIDRLAARAFTVGDTRQYQRLMALGARANLSEDFAAAATAYRAALKLQQTALGHDNPNTSETLMSLALQLSDQGYFSEADAVFAEAGRLAPNAADRVTPARLLHYRALHSLNQNQNDEALALLADAARAYTALVPPEAISGPAGGHLTGFPSQLVFTDPAAQSALLGLIEVHRYRSVVLRKTEQIDAAQASLRDAERLAAANALEQPVIGARIARTASQIDPEQHAAATMRLSHAESDFRLSLPLTRPFAATELLQAAIEMRDGDPTGAIEHCRGAVRVLRDLKLGIETPLLEPCLSAFAARAEQSAAERQTLLAEMFEIGELGQDSVTSRLIAQAAARLRESARDPRVAAAIRRRQDAAQALATHYRTRDALAQAARPDGRPYDGPRVDAKALDAKIAEALEEFNDSDGAMQEAAPNYGQLVQQVVAARDVLALLHPGEAFAQITVGSKETWTLLLRDGQISLGRSDTGLAAMTRLVVRLRATLQRGPSGMPPAFPAAPAHAIYAATFGTVESQMTSPVSPAGAPLLVVAPSGPLLSLPFGLLLTGDFSGTDLRTAPWLLRATAIAHVPSAANFAGLRRAAGTGRAGRPWFGFGDFRPVTPAAAALSFPGAACAETAIAFAGLPPLPHSREELDAARGIMGASAADEVLGSAFTAEAVRRAPLKNYRFIHFSTHALLPSELECQPQPIIVTSAPPGAATADGAMLLADDALGLDLDADAVILSACNSGGRGGKLAGESLSALARAFFYAGSRALLATHWSLNDAAGERLVSGMLRGYTATPGLGLARSLRLAQLALLDSAGTPGVPVEVAHPFFWAPMALIGEGGGQSGTATAAR